MKFNVIHPDSKSMEVLKTAIDEQETIFRSPHVGNVNASELALIFAVCEMGGNMQLELVDTIHGDDKYSRPRIAKIGNNAINLASRSYAKGRIVGECIAESGAIELLGRLGLDFGLDQLERQTLKDIHLMSLQEALPDSVAINVSTAFFAEIGQPAYSMILSESAKFLDRPLRMVDKHGKIVPCDTEVKDFSHIYGLGSKSPSGLLPPLEGMMAIEVVKKVLESKGSDCRLVHIAGPDMIAYTRLDEIMDPVGKIARSVLSELGALASTEVDYVLPCMKAILASAGSSALPAGVGSQYDILTARQETMC